MQKKILLMLSHDSGIVLPYGDAWLNALLDAQPVSVTRDIDGGTEVKLTGELMRPVTIIPAAAVD